MCIRDRYNLESPSVETEVRVLYDDYYVYIAFQNYDPDPSSIMDRISRRDDYEAIEKSVDWVGFGIDSNNDDMTGNWFMLTAAEVQLDVSINESGGWRDKYDISWNAVWDGKTQIHSEGWSAEIRVHINVLQFSKNEIQTWGGTFQRGYFKDQEQIHWPGRSKGVKNTVPYYGAINGIKNIPQPKNLELVPYVLAGQTQSDELNNEMIIDFSIVLPRVVTTMVAQFRSIVYVHKVLVHDFGLTFWRAFWCLRRWGGLHGSFLGWAIWLMGSFCCSPLRCDRKLIWDFQSRVSVSLGP